MSAQPLNMPVLYRENLQSMNCFCVHTGIMKIWDKVHGSAHGFYKWEHCALMSLLCSLWKKASGTKWNVCQSHPGYNVFKTVVLKHCYDHILCPWIIPDLNNTIAHSVITQQTSWIALRISISDCFLHENDVYGIFCASFLSNLYQHCWWHLLAGWNGGDLKKGFLACRVPASCSNTTRLSLCVWPDAQTVTGAEHVLRGWLWTQEENVL